ncbi:MucB/RseB C-terminal domain-containing protein [Marinomonas transparens]|uniref:MucB/RseB C-terminal domain-containing protein n=1 Tax=Marinomonas transparens TaxID=2795388 RepID=A0A934JRG8_9GAMM|nr:MucB/RseB C-terminal domain-containing protein [Marinomonas transparens]MBJ7536916.1 MucB/RseB C-terminal domain-containing protein [Marinomonas transparens]
MKLSSLVQVVLLTLSVFVSAIGMANTVTPDALQLLRQMTQSLSTLSYEGVFIHSESSHMNSMRVRHDLMGGVEYESLVDLDGDKVEVLRIDNNVICVYPNASIANTRSPLLPPFKRFKDLASERLEQGYDMEVDEGISRIAGRDAIVIRLMPKDNYRYGHEFWLDEENHFLLKHDMVTAQGELLERIQFTSVNFSPDLKPQDFVPKKGSYSQPLLEAQPRRIKNLWKFDWLPDGFVLVWPDARALNHGTSMLLLSDGMSTISVFIEPSMKTKSLSILNMGATIAGERSIRVGEQVYLLTMVGEVPKSTVEKLMSVFMPRSSS